MIVSLECANNAIVSYPLGGVVNWFRWWLVQWRISSEWMWRYSKNRGFLWI